MREKLDIIISGGTLLTMSKNADIVMNPRIGIRNGIIRSVDTGDIPRDQMSAAEIIDATDSVILPGLVNTHTHLPMVCFRGLADDLPLMEWLNSYIFPAEARYVDRPMVYYGSMLAIAEMILSGTTTFCDGYFYESSVAQAALEAGMRAVPCQGFIDFPTMDNPDQTKNRQIGRAFVEKWNGVSPLIIPAFFCHSPYTCSPATLTGIKELSRESGVLYLTHVAETREEVATIRNQYGTTPVRHLQNLGVLDEHTVAVHCNWLDDEEIAILARNGAKVSHNPESSMKLAAGIAPIPKMMNAGITVGLGTDGAASNNDLDLFTEMDTAAKIHKLRSMDPTVMDARTVVTMATIGGARLLGLDDRIGSVEVGKAADLIIIDMNKPHLTPMYNPYSHLVYAAAGSDVTTVIINGKIVMRDRKLLTIDIAEVMERVRKIAENIRNDRSP
ncbi:MAG TPA: amidohydrolase [Deltaproteobacteria bacterium]|nr:amidohydrolase [Deltaproteobacteria bacterium]